VVNNFYVTILQYKNVILLTLEVLVNGTQELCKQYLYNLRRWLTPTIFIMHAKHAGAAQAAQPLAASRRYAPPYTSSSFRIGIY